MLRPKLLFLEQGPIHSHTQQTKEIFMRKRLSQELARDANLLITMGCGDNCPYVPGLRRDDWPLENPKGLPIDEVRAIRDEIRERILPGNWPL